MWCFRACMAMCITALILASAVVGDVADQAIHAPNYGIEQQLSAATQRSPSAVFVVNTVLDGVPGSLRAAIQAANATPGPDLITFNIPGPGPYLLWILPPGLPALTDPTGVTIDGLTQPGSASGTNPPSTAVLQIILTGPQAGPTPGLLVQSSHNVIRGLVINQFMEDGIRIEGTSAAEACDNIVECCFVGTDVTGTVDQGNGVPSPLWGGIRIKNQPGGIACRNLVVRNLVSGNWADGIAVIGPQLPGDVFLNQILYNYVGTDITGMLDLGNDHEGVCLAEGTHDNLVRGNLIAGNDFDGVGIQGFNNSGFGLPILTNHNTVDSNAIGINAAAATLPNTFHGVAIGLYGQGLWGCAAENRIGPGNRIATNRGAGVAVWEDPINAANADRNEITANSIYDNAGLGIDLVVNGVTLNDLGDLDTGPNEELNFPVITGISYAGGLTTVNGSVSIPSDPTLARVELFLASPDPTGYGEGRAYLGAAVPIPVGTWSLTIGTASPGDLLTTTVIDDKGNTSEFSAVMQVPGASLDTCEYYKAADPDYTPAGMPDFDQKQNGWWSGMPPGAPWTHCGPVALADCLWWFDSKFDTCTSPPPTVCDQYPLVRGMTQGDDHDPANVFPLVDSLAKLANTNVVLPGTNIFDLATAVQTWIAGAGLATNYTVQVVPIEPAFGYDYLKKQVLASQDVILLLGFWQEVAQGYCERLGGHFVTVAGVCIDPATPAFCISDPYFDANEGAVHPSNVHNDAQFVSGPHGTRHHDRYSVTPTICLPTVPPAFHLELAGYPVNAANVNNFLGQNYYNPGWVPVQPIGAPIHTILEFALIICPADTCAGQKPGDANSDGVIDINDVSFLVDYLTIGGPAPVPLANGDPNGDCIINYHDITYLTDFFTGGGPAPVDCTCVAPKTTCCKGNTGNIDCSPLQAPDIGDLTTLIDNMFISFTPLCCPEEANCDGSGDPAAPDIGDLTALVDYLFISFTPIAPCD